MNNMITNQYNPNQVSPPGETLEELLRAVGMTQAQLAERSGRPRKTINEIIKGKSAITPETALQFERVLGVPASFWNNREKNYRECLACSEESDQLQSQHKWLRQFPLAAMIKSGLIKKCTDTTEQLREVLGYFGVASPKQWSAVWKSVHYLSRHTAAYESNFASIATWLRAGEIRAREITTAPYDSNKFTHELHEMRALALRDVETYRAELPKRCALCGVAVVFVRELPKMRLSGATRWLSSEKALIQLSLRYKTEDQLWFSFYHEAAHILLHGKRDVFLDGKPDNSAQEKEADLFAANTLLPSNEYAAFLSKKDFHEQAIKNFAAKIGVAPGTVVGRLQHDSFIPYNYHNDLKKRLKWTN